MPVEIRELHIRVVVDTATTRREAPQAGAAPAAAGLDRNIVVAECVEQVLQILQARRER